MVTRARAWSAAARRAVVVGVATWALWTVGERVAAEWTAFRRGGYGDVVAPVAALGARLPDEPVEFLTDATDPTERGFRLFVTQYALAPRPVADADAEDPPTWPGGAAPRWALAWLSHPETGAALPARRGLEVVARSGEDLLLLRVRP